MVASSRLAFADLSRQKTYETDLAGEDLSPDHTVGQAIDFYLERMNIPRHELRFAAFSRGMKLDAKRRLKDLPEQDAALTVIPEVSAG